MRYVEKCDTVEQVTDDSRAHAHCWIPKVKDTPQRYVIIYGKENAN